MSYEFEKGLYNDRDLDEIAQEFKKQSTLLTRLLSSDELTVTPFLPGLPLFQKLAQQKQHEVLESINTSLSIFREQVETGYKIKDNHSLIWRALVKFGLTPPSDLFTHLNDTDIIEVYDRDGRQIFRNFCFYEHCSYTLEELHSLEWWHLFHRDPAVTDALMTEVQAIYKGEVSGVFFSKTENHIVKELVSAEKLSNFYKAKVFCPLYAHKKVEGLLVSIEAKSIPS